MSNEIKVFYESNKTLYTIARNDSGQVRYIAGDTWETWGNGGHARTDYDVALTDKDGDLYLGNFVSFCTTPPIAAGKYVIDVFEQLGASPADGDNLIGTDILYWDGTAEVFVINTSGRVDVGLWKGETASSFPTYFASMNIDASGTIAADVKEWKTVEAPDFPANFSDLAIVETTGQVDVGLWKTEQAPDFPANFSQLAILINTGQVGINWANIANSSANISLSDTTIGHLAAEAILPYTLKDGVYEKIADYNWNEPSTGHLDGNKAGAQLWTVLTACLKILEADTFVDTTTTPWRLQVREAGTDTKLLEKKLYTVLGASIVDDDTPVGRQTRVW